MTTETEVEKSPREIARQIVRGCRSYARGNLVKVEDAVETIEKALRDRDERAARIAERAFEPAHTYASENSSAYRTYDAGQRHVIEKIASAIRGTNK